MSRTVGLIHHDEKPAEEKFACPHCGKEYKSGAALKTHVEKTHPQVFDDQD